MLASDPSIRLLRAWATQNHGVFTRGDASRFGVTEHQLRRGFTQNQWRHYRGALILGGFPDDDLARLTSALLHSGSVAAVTGPSALRLYGFDVEPDGPWQRRFPHPTDACFLSVPTGFHARIDGVVFLRESLYPDKVIDVHGFPTVDPERAVIDAVRLLGWSRTKSVVYRALQTRFLTTTALCNKTEELKNRRGSPELRRAAVAAVSGSHAESELVAQRIIRRAGLINFEANVAVHDAIGLIGYVDIAFVQQKLAIEIDGQAWHSENSRFQHDRRRQNRLTNLGWQVLRFTWEDLKERENYVIRTIRSALISP